MPSRRELIRMSEQEMREFLRSSRTIMINSIGPGGYPHPMPMWFALDDDGTVRMTTFRKSQKVLNLRRDPRVSLLAEAGHEYSELRGIVIYGKAEVVDDPEGVKASLLRIGGAGDDPDPSARAAADAVISKTAAKRVAILIRPEKVVSWDHRKLGCTSWAPRLPTARARRPGPGPWRSPRSSAPAPATRPARPTGPSRRAWRRSSASSSRSSRSARRACASTSRARC